MAKKFVRGITDIKKINNQDFDTNNVNDLLSDGKHNYIHRKKGKTEEYHNLTDNIKTISSSNTDLIEVTNNNTTNNTATLNPKHDAQKEQVLEPANDTITIAHGTNSTNDKTTLKVSDNLVNTINNKQDRLSVGDGLTLNNNKINIKPKYITVVPNSNGIYNGNVVPNEGISYVVLSLETEVNKYIQLAFRETVSNNGRITAKYRFAKNNITTDWYEMLIDDATIKGLLAQKQNTLVPNTSIGVLPNGELRQLIAFRSTYSHANGTMKTHIKSVAENSNVNTPLIEYNFIVKIIKGSSSVNFSLNDYDTTQFRAIMSKYGENNTVRINGCVFTLSGSTLTVSTTNNTNQNYVITFSDII